MILDRVVVWKDRVGDWRWTLYARNRKKVATSGEGYENEDWAVHMAKSLFPDTTLIVKEEDHGEDEAEQEDAQQEEEPRRKAG